MPSAANLEELERLDLSMSLEEASESLPESDAEFIDDIPDDDDIADKTLFRPTTPTADTAAFTRALEHRYQEAKDAYDYMFVEENGLMYRLFPEYLVPETYYQPICLLHVNPLLTAAPPAVKASSAATVTVPKSSSDEHKPKTPEKKKQQQPQTPPTSATTNGDDEGTFITENGFEARLTVASKYLTGADGPGILLKLRKDGSGGFPTTTDVAQDVTTILSSDMLVNISSDLVALGHTESGECAGIALLMVAQPDQADIITKLEKAASVDKEKYLSFSCARLPDLKRSKDTLPFYTLTKVPTKSSRQKPEPSEPNPSVEESIITTQATSKGPSVLSVDTLASQAHTQILKGLRSATRLADVIHSHCSNGDQSSEGDAGNVDATKKGRGRAALRTLAEALRNNRIRFVAFDAEHALVTKSSNAIPLEFCFHPVELPGSTHSLRPYHTFVHPGDLEYREGTIVLLPTSSKTPATTQFSSLSYVTPNMEMQCYPLNSLGVDSPSLITTKAAMSIPASSTDTQQDMIQNLRSEIDREKGELRLDTALKLSTCRVPGAHAIPLRDASFLVNDYTSIVYSIEQEVGFLLPGAVDASKVNDPATGPKDVNDGILTILINEGGAVSDIHALRWLYASSNALGATNFDLSLESLLTMPIFDLSALEGLVRNTLTGAGLWDDSYAQQKLSRVDTEKECCWYHEKVNWFVEQYATVLREETDESVRQAWESLVYLQNIETTPHCARQDSFGLMNKIQSILTKLLEVSDDKC